MMASLLSSRTAARRFAAASISSSSSSLAGNGSSSLLRRHHHDSFSATATASTASSNFAIAAPTVSSLSTSSFSSFANSSSFDSFARNVTTLAVTMGALAVCLNQQNNPNNGQTTQMEALPTLSESSVSTSTASSSNNNKLPDMKGLSKALAQREERQKVVLGRLLKELHEIAELAVEEETHRKEEERDRAAQELLAKMQQEEEEDDEEEEDERAQPETVNTLVGSDQLIGDDGTINLANISDLTQMTPQTAWEIVHALREGTGALQRDDLKRIARAAAQVLKAEPSLIDLRQRNDLESVTVVGDLHGHFDSLMQVLDLVSGQDNKDKEKESETDQEDQHHKDEDQSITNTITSTAIVEDDIGHEDNSTDSTTDTDAATTATTTAAAADAPTPWNGKAAVVFNGDFVDRGDNSIDCMTSLLILKLAYPDTVYLNRGNHEDSVLSTVYGYMEELQDRYNDKDVKDIWDSITEMFAALPLAVVTKTAIILHGGIPSEDFQLSEISDITSEQRCSKPSLMEPDDDDAVGQMMQAILWSDPRPEVGIDVNEDRGAGVFFGPDVAQRFLQDHGLQYLIRSHEPVEFGYESLHGEGCSTVTVFSANNYPVGEGYNWGAIIRLPAPTADHGEMEAVPFQGTKSSEDSEEEFNQRTFRAVTELIGANRFSLEAEFERLAEINQRRRKLKRRFSGQGSNRVEEEEKATLISPQQWADAMSFILQLPQLDWLSFQPSMAPTMKSSSAASTLVHQHEDHCSHRPPSDGISTLPSTSDPSNSSVVMATSAHHTVSDHQPLEDSGLIDYKIFLEMHCNPIAGSDQMKSLDPKTLDVLMENHSMLLTVFKFLDSDQSGSIDREEFAQGMKLLREKRKSSGSSGGDAASLLGGDGDDQDAIFDAIDLDGSGTIELDEFEKAFQSIEMPTDLAVFKIFDADRNGSIDREEFIQGVELLNQRLPPAEKIHDANALFDKIDDDGSGEIDLDELRAALKEFFPTL